LIQLNPMSMTITFSYSVLWKTSDCMSLYKLHFTYGINCHIP